jgi:hypothetical protein
VNPVRSGTPPPADIAIMTPRCEVAPVILAVYLLSDVPFALLLPVDLLDQTRRPGIFADARIEEVARRLEIAGKIVLLEAQMVWVIGNLPGCRPTEIFSNHLRTPAPITGVIQPLVYLECRAQCLTRWRTPKARFHARSKHRSVPSKLTKTSPPC